MKTLLLKIGLSSASFCAALAAAELALPFLLPLDSELDQPRLFVHGDQVNVWAPPIDLLQPVAVGDVSPGHPQEEQVILFQLPPNFDYAHQYPSNPRGYFDSQNRVYYQTDAHGLRTPIIPPDKNFLEAANREIVVLGDSFTWGEGVRYLDTYVSRLQGAAARSGSRPRARFVNFSQPGLDTAQEFVLWLKHKETVDPDLVILGFVPNDITGSPTQAARKQALDKAYTDLFAPPQGLARYSRLMNFGKRRLRRALLDRAIVDARVGELHFPDLGGQSPWDRCAVQLRQLSNDVRADGAAFMIVLLPSIAELEGEYRFQPIHDAGTGLCEEERIHVLDLLPAFEDGEPEQLWVHPVDHHPNERAHRIIADAILADPFFSSFMDPDSSPLPAAPAMSRD